MAVIEKGLFRKEIFEGDRCVCDDISVCDDGSIIFILEDNGITGSFSVCRLLELSDDYLGHRLRRQYSILKPFSGGHNLNEALAFIMKSASTYWMITSS